MAEPSLPPIERNLTSLVDSLAFLAEASQVLGSSLNHQTVLERLANLVVPSLADWCAVDVIEEDGRPQRVAVARSEPAGRRLGERMSTLRLEELPSGSAIIVPLIARGRTLGAMTLVTDPEKRTYGATERSLAEDLASRAALAVDNARLFSERSHVARVLQRSLLPPHLPQIPGVEVAARYHAAGEGIDVGGDFYDLFRTAKDDWAILVGDVCGKGADAAALTALARYTVRAAAMQARKPSRVLSTLNEALLAEASRRGSPDERFCTVAYTRLRPTANAIRITTASGGHPPPLVVRADGRVEQACATGTLLGVVPQPKLSDRTTELAPGDVALFYTDGVTEARGPDGALGDAGLRQLVSECSTLDAPTIAERIEHFVLDFQDGNARDDVALIVLRVPA